MLIEVPWLEHFGEVVKPGTMEMEVEMETEMETELEMEMEMEMEMVEMQTALAVPKCLAVLTPSKLQSPFNSPTVQYKGRQTRLLFRISARFHWDLPP